MPDLLQIDNSGVASPQYPAQSAISAVMLAALISVGTGGIADGRHLALANGTTAQRLILPKRNEPASIENTSVSSLLARIRATFDLTTVDLAAVLDVSRQTIYDWVAERQRPQMEKQQRLNALYDLSIAWKDALASYPGTTQKRFADKPQLIAVLRAEDLDPVTVRASLLTIAGARAGIAADRVSVVQRMREHGYSFASKSAQQASLNDAAL